MKTKNQKNSEIAPSGWRTLLPFSANLERLLAVSRLNSEEFDQFIIEDIVVETNGITEKPTISRRQLSQQEINSIVSSLHVTKENVYQGIIPKNVIYSDPFMQKYVWIVPARKVKINHKISTWAKGCHFVFPALVMMQYASLYVMAYDGKGRPTESTQLRSLVLPNYDNDNGWNCLSQEMSKRDTIEEMIAARTGQFFTWKFNSWAHNSFAPEIKKLAYDEYTRERPEGDLSFNLNKLPKACNLKQFISIT